MRWSRNLYYYAGAALMTLAVVFLVSSLADPGILTGFILRAEPDEAGVTDERKAEVEGEYGVSFAFPKRGPDKVSLYVPEYDYIELPQAEPVLGFFDISEGGGYDEVDVDGSFYTFIGERGQVMVNKYFNRIVVSYETVAEQSGGSELSDADVVERTLDYLESGSMPVSYEEITISRDNSQDNGLITAVLYPKTGGFLNHGHPVTVTMDEFGNVLNLDYFRLSYEKMASIGIITMKEAYYQLPPLQSLGILEGDNLRADLNKCELVYVFWDSILQPSYFFEGQAIDKDSGETARFSYYVNAAKFE